MTVYLWCISCQKVYFMSDWESGFCPGCGLDGFLNAFNWDSSCSDFRIANGYPDNPVIGGFYPMLANDPERNATIDIGGSLYWSIREVLELIL